VGNRWLRLGDGRPVDAGLDPDFALVGGGKPGAPGFSPRDLKAPTLGDTFKRASGGRSRVVTVALKDRTSVLLAGPSADASLWFDEDTGNWVTSRFYSPDGTLAPYVTAWNKAHHPDADFARVWKPELSPSPLPPSTAGDGEIQGIAGDYKGIGATFPHRIDGGRPESPNSDFYIAWTHTPWALTSNVELALESVDFYGMGQDAAPDLLYVGIASLDKVGHVFGPDSPEALEMLLQIDRALATLLDGLDKRVGLNNCLLVMTSDHGVVPLVDHLQEFRTVAQRLPLAEVRQRLVQRLATRWSSQDYRLEISDPHIFLSPAPGKEAEKPAMLAMLKLELESIDGVLKALESENLAQGRHRDTSWESTIARSIFPGRSGDLLLICQPNTFLGFSRAGGTNHGSPWTDDTHVPLLMYGWPTPSGIERRTCAPRQLVSTICLALGLTPPGGCDAEPLPWAVEP
jgi:hypothetical protein